MSILAAVIAAAIANPAACSASQVYARNHAVTGGDAWSSVAEVVAQGVVESAGLRGTYTAAADLIDGRSALSESLGVQSTSSVFDGRYEWRQDYSGGVHALDSPNARAEAQTASYLNRRGYLRDDPQGATLSCLGLRREGGRTFYAMRIAPKDGLPVDQWIDAASYLVDRTIATTPTSTVVTSESDYRQIGPVVLPFATRQVEVGDEADAIEFRVSSYALSTHVDSRRYRRPPDPTNTTSSGRRPTTVPISVERGDIIVYAKIDGEGPLPFILDTGGHAILTPEAARGLGLRTMGAGSSGGGGSGRVGVSYTFARSLTIGDIAIPNQPFLVIPYDNDFSDRGSRPRLAGILGLEVFERLAVRIDYAHAAMTLTPAASFHQVGPSVRVPIVFQEDIPLAVASADGYAGLFGIDTGNSGSPIMFGPFLQSHGFLKRYALGAAATSSGTGGAVYSSTQVLASLQFAHRSLRNILAYFVVGQHGGSFSSSTEAGNLGYQVLANFVPTYDYRRSVMFLAPATAGPLPARGRAGLGLSKESHAFFSVVGVLPNSPASDAGIVTGDTISAVNGRPASSLSPADVYGLVRQRAGAVLSLDVVHGTSTRVVHLTLRDIPVARD